MTNELKLVICVLGRPRGLEAREEAESVAAVMTSQYV
jgi:hypothetical protein